MRKRKAPTSAEDNGNVVPNIAISDSKLTNSPTVAGDQNTICYTTYNIILPGGTSDVSNQPPAIIETIATIARALNTADPHFRHTVTTDGQSTTVEVEPISPDTTVQINAAISVIDGKTMDDYVRQALETQEPVTISNVKEFKLYHNDRLVRDVPDGGTITITQSAIGPPLRCALIVPETGARIDNIELECFSLPDGRLRLTNKRQRNAIITATFDVKPDPPHDGSDELVGAQGGEGLVSEAWTLHLEARSIEGHTLRQILAVHDLVRSLREPRSLEIYSYATCAPIATGRINITIPPNPVEDRLMAAMRVIQQAFPYLSFAVPQALHPDDLKLVMELESILTTGEQTGSITEARVTLFPSSAEYLPDDGIIPNAILTQKCMVNLWSTALDLGDVETEIGPMRVVQNVPAVKTYAASLTDADRIVIDLLPASEDTAQSVRRFKKFRRDA